VGVLLAVTAVLAGCGLLPGSVSGPGFQGGASCGMMPGGVCQEQIDLAVARHPDAAQVDVADVRVQFADGSEFQSNTGWGGAAP
jgi:hypothetical protein